MSSRQDQLQALLADAQEQLLARDDAIRSLRSEEFAKQGEAIRWLEDLLAERDKEIEWLRGVVEEKESAAASLREQVEHEAARRREREQTLSAVQSTRLWRLGHRYWKLRDHLRRKR